MSQFLWPKFSVKSFRTGSFWNGSLDSYSCETRYASVLAVYMQLTSMTNETR